MDATLRDDDTPDHRDRPAVIAVAAWVLILGANAAAGYALTDPFWMIREGQDVLAGGGWVHPDRWGAAIPAPTFHPTSPLWQLLLALGWNAGGGAWGLYGAALITIVGSLVVLSLVSRALGAAPLAIILGLWWIALIPTALTYRPTLASMTLLIAEWALVSAALATRGRPGVQASAVILITAGTSALGIWLHASWTLYGPLGGLGAAWLLRRSSNTSWALALATAVVGAAGTVVGPSGTGAWAEAIRVRAETTGQISEWNPPWSNSQPVVWTALWLVVVAVALSLAMSAWRRRSQAPALELLLAGMALATALAAGTALRFVLQSVILMVPLIAVAATRSASTDSVARWRARLADRGTTHYWGTVLALVALALSPATAMQARPLYPVLEDPAVAALPRSCTLMADPAVANIVLLARPDVRTWIDGRADMWGRDRLVMARSYLRGNASMAAPADATCALTAVRDRGLGRRLAADENFRPMLRSDRYVTWTRS